MKIAYSTVFWFAVAFCSVVIIGYSVFGVPGEIANPMITAIFSFTMLLRIWVWLDGFVRELLEQR